jgi:replicative DNA helicase
MPEFIDYQISALRHCVGFDDVAPESLLAFVDAGITSVTFQVYSGADGLAPTPAALIYEAAVDYYLRYTRLIPPTVCVEIVAETAPEHLAGPAASLIAQIADLPYEPRDIPRLIETIQVYARQAQAFAKISESTRLMRQPNDFDSAVDRLVASLSQIRESNGHGAPYTTLTEAGAADVARLTELRTNPERARGTLTGIAGFDMATLGLFPGELLLLVGQEKSGKSSIMLHIAKTMHARGDSPAIALHEMSVALEIRRYAAMSLCEDIDDPQLMRSLKAGSLNNRDFAAYKAMWESARQQPGEIFLIHPHRCRTIDQLEAAVIEISRKRQITCLMIDAGQRKGVERTSTEAFSPQYQRVVVERCMTLALRYGFPLVVELQTTRAYDPKTGLDVIGQSKAWGEACTYALLVEQKTGLQRTLQMIGARDASTESVYNMLVDPERMFVANAPRMPGGAS